MKRWDVMLFAGLVLVGIGCIYVGKSGSGFQSLSVSSSGDNRVDVTDLKPDPTDPNRLIGAWSGRFESRDNHFIILQQIRRGPGGQEVVSGSGISGEEINPLFRKNDGDVHAQIKRDAGTLSFDGVLKGGKGSGTFSFAQNAVNVQALSQQTGQTIKLQRAMDLALADVSLDYAKSIAAAGYKTSTDDLIGLRNAGVTAEYAVGMKDAGYKFAPGDLRSLRFAGIDTDWAKAYRDGGYQFSANDLRSLRFGGIPPEFAAEMKKAGYDLDVNGLRTLRFAGVPSEFAAKLREAGYRFNVDDLRALRFAGVDPEQAAAIKKGGYDFSADDLRRLRFAGVDADYALAAVSKGHQNLTAEDLVRLRNRGLDAATIQKLRQ